jgi:hypothetical protein
MGIMRLTKDTYKNIVAVIQARNAKCTWAAAAVAWDIAAEVEGTVDTHRLHITSTPTAAAEPFRGIRAA